MLTQEKLKELLHYDPETGIFTWKVKGSSRAMPGDEAGYINGDGYRLIGIRRKYYTGQRLAWLYMNGEGPSHFVDHIDVCPSNNAWLNLRDSSNKQNMENSPCRCDNTSGFRGVSLIKTTGRWRASICHHGKQINLGHFNTPEEASAAYEAMRDKLFTHHKKAA